MDADEFFCRPGLHVRPCGFADYLDRCRCGCSADGRWCMPEVGEPYQIFDSHGR